MRRSATDNLAERVARMPDFVVGGRLCLDFANTVEPRGGPAGGPGRHDYLADYPDLVAWALRVDVVDLPAARALLRAAAAEPDMGGAFFADAIALREAIYRVFSAIAHGEEPAAVDREFIAAAYRVALDHAQLAPRAGGFGWDWPERDDLGWPTWMVARSAVELLTTGEPARIKSCPGGGDSPLPCAWLFYDTSKNRARRWCTMADCGNATKARRLTERRRQARAAASREPLAASR